MEQHFRRRGDHSIHKRDRGSPDLFLPDLNPGDNACEGVDDARPTWLKSRAHIRFCLAIGLATLDLLALGIGFAAASIIWFQAAPPIGEVSLLAVMSILYCACGFVVGAYTGSALIDAGEAIRRSMIAFYSGFGILLAILFLLKADADVSRARVIASIGVAGVALVCVRYWFTRWSFRALNGRLYSTVLLRDGVADLAYERPGGAASIDVSGILDLTAPNAETYDGLATIIGNADRVVVICDRDRRPLWADVLKGMNVRAEVIAPELKSIAPLGISGFAGNTTLVLARGPLSFPSRIIKRAFDITVSLLALIVLIVPLLVTAAAIRLDSPGPIFFRQPRIGRQNKIFWVLKFRSMYSDACDISASRLTTVGDSRVTRVGQFIRRTSIDELPQLINVLRGEMSIVGPRPHAIKAKAAELLYWHADPRYWHRHACKPGITGLAQVRGYRGATDHQQDLINRVDSDLDYLSGWSLWNDVVILVQTIKVVLHPNAY